MRGKVKYVYRNVWLRENQSHRHDPDIHAVRETHTCAMLYNGDFVEIDEDDIRDYYGRSRITDSLVDELSDDLHNVWIEYDEGDDGNYWLEGYLSDYI